jgi:hypothetical protein
MNQILLVSILLLVVAVLAVIYFMRSTQSQACPTELHRFTDGTLRLEPSGRTFADMDDFSRWWQGSGINASCPLPVLTGAKEQDVMDGAVWPNEQTYAKTPIYKVDDYEFSRVFGYERNGHMIVPRQNFNMILNDRTFDWSNKPLTSDERRDKYKGLQEGFSADGELRAVIATSAADDADEKECHKESREFKEVKALVKKAYANDDSFEPVITKVGPNQWEVAELKPKRKHGNYEAPIPEHDRVVNTAEDNVDIRFRFRETEDIKSAIDPYYPAEGQLGWDSERVNHSNDPFLGVVPNMDRMFGPTFDHKDWTNSGGAGGV